MKWLLTIGVVLIIVGSILIFLPSQTFEQFAEVISLSTTTYNSTSLVQPQLIQIPPNNYNFSFLISKGFTLTVNFTVVTGGTVSVLGFDQTGFNQWSSTSSGVPLFFTYPSRNGTFSYIILKDDNYHIVLVSSEKDKSIVLVAMNSVTEKQSPSFWALLIGPVLLGIGAIIVLFRIQPDFIAPKLQRRDQEIEQVKATIRVAKTLGIQIQGKTIDQIRKEIKEYMDKEKTSTQ